MEHKYEPKESMQYVGRLNFCSKLPLNKKSLRFWLVSCQSCRLKIIEKRAHCSGRYFLPGYAYENLIDVYFTKYF